jgi:hypothetical protein
MSSRNGKQFDAERCSTGSSGATHLENVNSSESLTETLDHVPLYSGGKVNLIPMPTSDPKGKSQVSQID